MKGGLKAMGFVLVAIPFVCPEVHAESGRIYGKVYTQDDEVYEGRIRWDDHETFWDDILDATKNGSARSDRESRRVDKQIEVLGVKISWTQDEEQDGHRRFGIRLGRLRSIRRRSRKAAILELKDGSRLRVSSSGTDIGPSNRGIIIFDKDLGQITVDWSDFEKVVFSPEPDDYIPASEESEWRLFGTVTTWDDQQFRGFIMWDKDESLSSDFLDGESRDEEMKIPFANIRAIERKSSSSATVELISGRKLRLRGTNDVNDENRGIVVRVAHLGQVTVGWDDFERAEFGRPAPGDLRGYDDFDAGEALYGTVWDDLGEKYQGSIRWDDDETMTYEFLDGEMDDIHVMLEFSDIQSLQRRSSRSARVTLKSGQVLILEGTCDVDDENRGIFVEQEGGGAIQLDWDEFERVEFGRP
jgi:hypothetical protein